MKQRVVLQKRLFISLGKIFSFFFSFLLFFVSDISRVFSPAGKFNEKEFSGTAKRAVRGNPLVGFHFTGKA